MLKNFHSEKGYMGLILPLTIIAIFFLTTFLFHILYPPKDANDLDITNSVMYSVPLSQCETKGIIREDTPVRIDIVTSKGEVIETIPGKVVGRATNNEVKLLIKPKDAYMPLLSLNNLKLRLIPETSAR